MPRILRASFVFALLWAFAAPAYALDPILMFLFNAASQMIDSASQSARAPMPSSELPKTYAGTTVRPEQLKQLIDESFTYLSEKQRDEIFDSLNRELLEPKNAAIRGAMIQYFANHALQVRAAQLRLAQLSSAQKRALAAEFGQEVGGLPADEVPKLRALLEKHLLPVPADLNSMLLAEFERHAPREAAARPTAVQ
ncbi:MAG: hypothetical protein M0015_04445 [Betaproteobacteria bacterium]|nr:hypothetical protein [Betaproteobacteria bacterium]